MFRDQMKLFDVVALSIISEVRIVDGTESGGLLEVYAFGQWQPVCYSNFGDVEATVACNELGYR